MNKKNIILTTLISSALIGGLAIGISYNNDIINTSAVESHSVTWTTGPELDEEGLYLLGDEGGKVGVTAENYTDGDSVVSLLPGGTFSNIGRTATPEGIGSITKVALTYTLNSNTELHDGATKSVLSLSYGFNLAEDNHIIYWSEPIAFANEYEFNELGKQPSYVKWTVTSASSIVHVKSITLTYKCKGHCYAKAEPGLYVVGEGSFVKNGYNWHGLGGTLLTWNGGSDQNEAVIDFKAGDKFAFRNQDNVWTSFNYCAGESEYFKHNNADHNVEILKDCKLGIYLKGNNDLYLAVK